MSATRGRARAGLTMFEMIVTLSLFAIVFAGLSMVFARTGGAVRTGTAVMDLEARGSRAMQRIVSALRTADQTSLGAVPAAPWSAATVTFQRNGGFDGSSTQWSSPYRIGIDAAGDLLLTENADLPDERSTPLCSGVPALLDGETLNGVDDNGNALRDEAGLCFTRDGPLLTIRLSLASRMPDGTPLNRTWMTRVLCRN